MYRVASMGVDLSRFDQEASPAVHDEMCADLTIPLDATLVLNVAYLTPEKGVFVFFEAAAIICAERRDIHFLLAGLGPSAERLKRGVGDHNLNSNFHILGWRHDVDKLMLGTDIFTLTIALF